MLKLFDVPPLDTEPSRYPHTCENCRFLGRYDLLDLYYCPERRPVRPSPLLVVRFGSHGGDYETWSVAAAGEPLEQPFIEAARRARAALLELTP